MALALAGCSGNGATSDVVPPPVVPPNGPGLAFTGTVNAGTQPVAGATVQLYAAGTTGNGSAATALLSAAVTTDATGSFTIPAGYPCPSSSSQLSLKARGGPLGTTSDIPSIAFFTAPGTCGQVAASSK